MKILLNLVQVYFSFILSLLAVSVHACSHIASMYSRILYRELDIYVPEISIAIHTLVYNNAP